MKEFIAKIDAAFDTIVHSNILAVINALLGFIGDALTDTLGEEEAGGIVKKLFEFGE